jgi:hypothetical protein
MRKILLQLSFPIGLLIFVAYKIIDHYIVIEDSIAYPMLIVSAICMMISSAYYGWCIGKRKNPYDFKSKKKGE